MSEIRPKSGKPRGILNPQAGAKKFELTRYLPAQDLSFFVERYWIVSWDLRGQEPYVQETLPYPCVNLVFEHGQTGVFGVQTGKFSRLLENAGRVFGIKFRPGAFYPFVKTSVTKFTNKSYSLQDTFGVADRTLEAAILSLEDPQKMQASVEDFLRARQPLQDKNILEINQIIDYIITHQEITRVDEVVSQLHLNKRSVQRLFNQYVGVNPKWVIKRYRLHEVAERVAEGKVIDWSELALDFGYFDQAHFIKDFKAIVGSTPAEYAKIVVDMPGFHHQ